MPERCLRKYKHKADGNDGDSLRVQSRIQSGHKNTEKDSSGNEDGTEKPSIPTGNLEGKPSKASESSKRQNSRSCHEGRNRRNMKKNKNIGKECKGNVEPHGKEKRKNPQNYPHG